MKAAPQTTQLELLSAHVPGDGDEKRPLTSLNEEETHIHGELRWTIAGRPVPRMGLWGPEDVCLGEWWDGLGEALAQLSAGGPYTLDSCEQGAPAFLFERRGSSVLLSLVAGLGGGGPVAEWQRVEFAWDDLVEQSRAFKQALRTLVGGSGLRSLPEEWSLRFNEPA